MLFRSVPVRKSVAFHPVRAHSYDLVESCVRVIYGSGVGARVRAAVDVARNLAAVIGERD